MNRSTTVMVMTAGCALSVGRAGAQTAFFMGLGDLPGGAAESRAFAISDDGATVAGRGSSANGQEAFAWTAAAGIVGLGDLPGGAFWSTVYSASSDGSVLAGYGRSGNEWYVGEACRWVLRGSPPRYEVEALGDLPGGGFDSVAADVSADGSAIVGWATPSNVVPGEAGEAFIWTAPNGPMIGLGDDPGGGFDSAAEGVSADGSVVVGGGWSSNSRTEAYRWERQGQQWTLQLLGDLPGGQVNLPPWGTLSLFSFGYGVSDDGAVVVGWGLSDSGFEACRWTFDGARWSPQGLGDLPGGPFNSAAYDVSPDGSVIVGKGNVAGIPWATAGGEAFLWDAAGGMRRVADELAAQGVTVPGGWELWIARSVTRIGGVVRIVGIGTNPAGQSEAWLAQLTLVCYPDCDTGTGRGVLDIFDFLCFQNRYAANDPYACDCDTSTGPGLCDIFDFLCFQNAYSAGCP